MCPISDGSAQNLALGLPCSKSISIKSWVPSLSCSSGLVPEQTAWAGEGLEISRGTTAVAAVAAVVGSGQRLCGSAGCRKAGSRKWRYAKPNHPVLCHSDSRSSSAHFCGMTLEIHPKPDSSSFQAILRS